MDRIPAEARFFAPNETGPGAHPAFYTMDVGFSSGVKRRARDSGHPPPSGAEDANGLEL